MPDQRAVCPRESSREKADPFHDETAMATAGVCDPDAQRDILVCMLWHREWHSGHPSVLPALPSFPTFALPPRCRGRRPNCHGGKKAWVILSIFRTNGVAAVDTNPTNCCGNLPG